MSDGEAAARWARVEALLAGSLELDPEERSAWLAEMCGGDADLLSEVKELLDAHDSPGLFDGVVERREGADEQLDDEATGSRLGPYEVDSVLGRGGMGLVYAAHRVDGQFEQEVALKVLPAGVLSGRMEERFRAERQILARLAHPNVARLLDGGMDDLGRPWFAMERIRGIPLLDHCDSNRLDLAARLDLFLTVCGAVQHAHQGLVVHRDLKPDNILVDESGAPKLLDFGIAKLVDPAARGPEALQTRTGVRVFTPAYAAPEQLRGEPANTASDIYQLGILLYELLTGVHPFPQRMTAAPSESGFGSERGGGRGPTRPSAATTSAEEARARSSTPAVLRQRLRGDLDAIILKALREEPERRYGTVAEMADDLRRFTSGRPVRARSDSRAYRAAKFVRRNAVGLAVAALAMGGVAAFAAGMAREARHTALERDRARAVSDFMQELFASAGPFASAGQEVTARQLLDDGAQRVRRQLNDQPVVRATLMDVIADAYWELGLAQPALALRQEALPLWRREAAQDTDYRPNLLFSLARTGRYLAERGDLDASRELLEEAEAALVHEPDEPTTLRGSALNSLGLSWQGHGEYDRAEPLLERAVAAFRGSRGDRLDAAAAMGNLAWVRLERNDPDSAEVLFRDALEMRRDALGADHLLVANTLEGLGNLYVRTGQLAQADSALRESVRIRAVGLPEDHFLLHSSRMGLARVVGREGDAAEADSLFRTAIDGIERTLGEGSSALAYAWNEYAIFFRNRGRALEAAEAFGRARNLYAGIFGSDHRNTALVGANHAWALHLAGRSAEAVPAFEAVLPVIDAAYDGGGRFLDNRQDYGVALCATVRREEAVVVLEEVLAGVEEELLEGDPTGALAPNRVLEARNALGSCLRDVGDLNAAEEVIRQVMDATADRPEHDPHRSFARRVLVDVFEAQGREEEARRLRAGG